MTTAASSTGPHGSPDSHARLEQVFLQVAAAAADDRTRLLNELCAGDAALRTEVESLLSNHQPEDDGFLDPRELMNGTDGLPTALQGAPDAFPAGTRFGGFTIKHVIGIGGMGVVYVADQDRPRRTVALKVIRPGFDSVGLTRRFQHEADILGRLNHPGIAPVFGAGSEVIGGVTRPYIAMELIHGHTLLEYARTHALDAAGKIRLMSSVCDAVHHAHQRGIIHRDLKPANILVDREGQPKVLDFGVARAADADLQVTTMNTTAGQFIGTLPYMSPEQVLADPREVDVRSDVYALGVVLYQLLTGKLPHDLASRSIPDAARIIRDEPPTRLSSINRMFRGEIETIVAKALEKDKTRRYQTAAELRDDLDRFIRGEPIAAKEDSALYVLRKQIKRYRGMVIAAAASLLLVTALSIVALMSASTARTERDKADEATKKTAEHAAQLAAQLSLSRIESARNMVQTGSTGVASDILWREALSGANPEESKWGLWALYRKSPVLASRVMGEGATPELAYTSVVINVGNGRLFTADRSGNVFLWNIDTLAREAKLGTTKGEVLYGSASHDHRTAATSTRSGVVQLWDISSLPARTEVLTDGGDTGIAGTAFSLDDKYLAVGSLEGSVRIWRLADKQIVWTLHDDTKNHPVVAFSPDGAWFAAVAGTTVQYWPLKDGLPTGEPRAVEGHSDPVGPMIFTNDSKTIISGSRDRDFRLWTMPDGELFTTLRAPNGPVGALKQSQDGQSLFSGGYWAAQRWYMGRDGLPQPGGWVPFGRIGAMDLADDGYRLICASADVRIVDYSMRPGVTALPKHRRRTRIAFGPDERVFATVDEDAILRVFLAHNGQLLACVKTERFTKDGKPVIGPTGSSRIWAPRFHPTLPYVVCGNETGALTVLDLRTGHVKSIDADVGGETGCAYEFSPDGKLLALCNKSDAFSVLRFPELTPHPTLGHLPYDKSQAIGVRFIDGGQTFAAVSRTDIMLWPVSDSQTPPTPRNTGIVSWNPAFTADSQSLITGRWDGSVATIDLATGKQTASLQGHQGLPTEIAIRPGNENWMLATAGVDGSVRLSDRRTGRTLALFDALDRWEITGLSFSPDGRQMGASDSYGNVFVWDLEYFDRHIAGNLEYAIQRLQRISPDASLAGADKLRAWSAQVMARPWPRTGEHAVGVATKGTGPSGIDPDQVASWGKPSLGTAWPGPRRNAE